MNEFLRWLLNVQSIPLDAEGVRLAWERPLPAWAWALILIAAGAIAVWSYSRLTGSNRARGVMAGLRSLALVLICILISGPMLELPRETIDRDWLVVLADRSRSMTIADVADGPHRVSRDAQMHRMFHNTLETWQTLDRQREVLWLGFDRGAFVPDRRDGDSMENHVDTRVPFPDFGTADGNQTRINTAIDQALSQVSGRPVTGIVLVSDGQTPDPPTRSLIRRLQQEQIPVHVIPVGSPDPLGDLAIRRADAPRRAFIRDQVPVHVQLDRIGDEAGQMAGIIRLIDELSGEELDSINLDPGDGPDGAQTEYTLTAEPDVSGHTTWKVVIETDQPALVPENTVRRFDIELIDRPLRVLYVDGYPRWEYRYVKNLLVREESIESSILLLSADRDFAQEGDVPLARMPRTREEFADFDVIVIGDAPGTFFSPRQLELIRSQVAERGTGLLWIAGPRYLPRTFAGTALADVLPMRPPLELTSIGQPITVRPTDIADRLGILQLSLAGETGWPEQLADPSYGWSQLHWAQRLELDRLKPTVEVLAETVAPMPSQPLPIVLSMRYGAGRTMYVATDEIWRWRYGRGELLPEQFWIQMIRLLGRQSLMSGDERAVLDIDPTRTTTEQPMTIELRVRNTSLVEIGRPSVSAVLEDGDGRSLAELVLRPDESDPLVFRLTYLTEQTGLLTVRIDDPDLADLDLAVTVEVMPPHDEMRRPQTDHDRLRSLAQETGGSVLDEDSIANLLDPDYLRDRSIRTPNPIREAIWDSPLAFILVLLLLTAEWIGRKIIRLA